MKTEHRLLAVIPTLNDDPTESIESINSQDVKVSKILVAVGSRKLFEELVSKTLKNVELVYVKPDFRKSLGERVSHAINAALERVKLQNYDYLLRLDADTILPPHFLAANIETDGDLTGIFGFAMLLKILPFIKLLNGRWPEVPHGEDTYIVHSYLRRGYSCKDYRLNPKLKRKSGGYHPWTYQFNRGIEMYKLGYEPMHALALSLDIREDRKTFFLIPGFALALLQKTKRYEFATWIFKEQVKELLKFKKLTAHTHSTFF